MNDLFLRIFHAFILLGLFLIKKIGPQLGDLEEPSEEKSWPALFFKLKISLKLLWHPKEKFTLCRCFDMLH